MADSFRLLKPGASRKRENDTPGEREGAWAPPPPAASSADSGQPRPAPRLTVPTRAGPFGRPFATSSMSHFGVSFSVALH